MELPDLYNWTLARQEENYKNGKFIKDGVLRKEITQLKKNELSWLKEVSNNVAKQAVKDACDSYKRFFLKKKYDYLTEDYQTYEVIIFTKQRTR